MSTVGGNATFDTAERFEVIILGAGITGLVSASELVSHGYTRILVVDEYGHVGGNHIDWSSGDYTFDVGSFIFQDDSPLLRHFPELLNRYTRIWPTWGRLTPQGTVSQYPISVRDDILGAGAMQAARILGSTIYSRLFRRRVRNAKEFATYWIGAELLCRSGLGSYMDRFYGIPASEIDLEFVRKRMLWISEHASIAGLVRRACGLRKQGSVNQQLARPKEGFGYLYQPAVERLGRHGVTFILAADLQELKKACGAFYLRANNHAFACDRVVATIPITRLQRLCGHPPDGLRTAALLSLFFSFSGKRGFKQSILYNFTHTGAWKRATMYSDFYGLAYGREYFTVEVLADKLDRCVSLAEDNFRKHIRSHGLFEGDLNLEGSYLLENAYPIYSAQSGRRAAEAIHTLSELGIESIGRQGGFNYQPTARVSTIEAEFALRSAQRGMNRRSPTPAKASNGTAGNGAQES